MSETAIHVDGVYQKAVHYPSQVQVNTRNPATLVRPLPEWGNIIQYQPVGRYNYKGLLWVQLNVRVTLSAGKGAFGVIPEWVQGVAAGQMDESWINKHGQLDSKGGPWQNAFPKSRSLPGAKQV